MNKLTKKDLVRLAKLVKREKELMERAKNSLNQEINVMYLGSVIETKDIEELETLYNAIGREIIHIDLEQKHVEYIEKADEKFIFGDDNATVAKNKELNIIATKLEDKLFAQGI